MTRSQSAILLFLAACLAAASLLALGAFAGVSAARFNNPLNNGPYEDASLQIAARQSSGAGGYADADASFVPSIYAPAAFVLMGWSTRLFGESLPSARLVSVVSTLLTLLGLILAVSITARFDLRAIRGRTCSHLLQAALLLAGPGLFLAFHAATHYWLEFAKVDAFFVLLLVSTFTTAAAIARATRPNALKERMIDAALGALLALLAVLLPLTKQTGAAFILVLPLAAALLGHRRLLAWSTFALACMLGSHLWFYLSDTQGPKYFTYAYEIPRTHPLLFEGVAEEIAGLFWPFGILFTGVTFSWAWRRFHGGPGENSMTAAAKRMLQGARLNAPPYLLVVFLCVAMAVSVVGRAKAGALENSHLYVIVFMAIAAGSVLFHLFGAAMAASEHSTEPGGGPGPAPFLWRLWGASGAACCVLLQFAVVAYDPRPMIEAGRQHERQAESFRTAYCGLAQPVLSPHTPYYTKLLCGTADGFLNQAVQDLLAHPEQMQKFHASIKQALSERRYGTIIETNLVDREAVLTGIRYIDHALSKSPPEKERRKLEAFRLALLTRMEMHASYRALAPHQMGRAEATILRHYPPGAVILVKR